MKIFNWNTEFVSPRARAGKFQKLSQLIASQEADIVCLTEAYPDAMPADGETIKSEISGRTNAEKSGARKVVLWSRNAWRGIDTIGSPALPEGRFLSAKTNICGKEWHIVGICIPWHGYRNYASQGEQRMKNWQGACQYLDALRNEILPRAGFRDRTIMLGDFNLQIPPKTYPRPNTPVNQKREATFAGWSIPTTGEKDDSALDKRFIDHIALTPEVRIQSLRFVSRFAADGTRLSDHNGVFIEVATP